MGRVKAMLGAVIGMGVLIAALTAILVATVIKRLVHPHPTATAEMVVLGAPVQLDQPAGTRIVAAVRQSDSSLALLLSGGGRPDRVLVWNEQDGRIIAQAGLLR
ncbi:hypothetical protein [Lichenicoccus roseus]|uniref:Uncharacterized protein n=1 Tax=Lichenicoccus roseus TaxID=2683649 RepID=A0A5R9J0S8_9PROT|nr:hypothetical protein [Lichenicoccus roseus]TLU71275.1 hypothetical protein FE263_17385 [Lichenicoccus roseus]